MINTLTKNCQRRLAIHFAVPLFVVLGALYAQPLAAQDATTGTSQLPPAAQLGDEEDQPPQPDQITNQSHQVPAAPQSEQFKANVDLKAPLEELAASIIDHVGKPMKIAEAELLAGQAATALLEAGELLSLNDFIDAFYNALYPPNNDSSVPAWQSLGPRQKLELQSLEIQYLVIRAELLKYNQGLLKQPSALTSPAELLKSRRAHLEQLMDNVRVAQDNIFERRKEVNADRYRQMSSALHMASARVSMSIADAGYRLRAASMVTSLTQGAPQTNSSAYYGAARQSLFESLILDPDNVRAKVLAAEIEDRLRWLRTGRSFGGNRFFEVEPVMGQFDGRKWTPLARLESATERLEELNAGQRADKDRRRNLDETVNKFVAALRQNRQRRQDQISRLSAEITDLQYRIQTSSIQAKGALDDSAKEVRDRLARSDVTRAELQHRGSALDKQIEAKTDELLKTLNELAGLTSQGNLIDPLKFKGFAKTAEQVLSETGDLIRKVREFEVDSIKTRAKKLGDSFNRLKAASGTTIELAETELERLKSVKTQAEEAVKQVTASIELAKSGYFDQVAKSNIEQVKSEVRSLETELAKVDLSTDQEIKKFSDKIYDITMGNFEREKARVEARIAEVEKKIDNAKQLIDLYKKNKERVEEAIAAAQLAVEAAASIPSGIIAGTASGTFTQKPQALMKVQELGLKIIDNAQKVAMDIKKAEQIIGDLASTVEQYKAEFQKISVDQMKAQMEKGIKEAKQAGVDLKQDLKKKLQAAEAQIATALQGSAERIEERFKLSTAKLAANKAEFDARVNAVKAEIRAAEARITAEQRKSRALIDQVEILKGDLYRLALEKQGILDSIKRAEAQVQRDVNDIEARAALETEQYDELTRPLVMRITHLQNMADKLASGGDAGGLPLPIDAMTAAAGGASIEDLTRERLAVLDEANRLLFQYANWLYLMSRNPVALEWAISAQSLYELKLALSQLGQVYQQLQSTVGLATPRYFVVRMPRAALEQAFLTRDGQLPEKLVFTVNPSLASLATRPPDVARRGDTEFVGEEDVSIYYPLESYLDNNSAVAGNLDGSSEIIFAPFIESEPGAHHLLWDAWVIPNWTSEEPPELSMVGLNPLGPTYYRINDETRGHPVLRTRDANASSTTYSYGRLRQQHELAIRHITGTNKNLISGTLPGMNYRSLLGRGLGNTWELTAPNKWSDLKIYAPSFDALKSIDVVFGYLISPERPAGLQLSGRMTSEAEQPKRPVSSRDCDTVQRRWLCTFQSIRMHERRARTQAERMAKAIKTPTGVDRSKAIGDARETYRFQNSPGAQTLRLQLLSEVADALPRAIQLSNRDDEEREVLPVLDVWRQEAGKDEVRAAFLKSFCIGDGADHSCAYRTRNPRASFAELAHQIVRDEMLSWSDAMAAPVGPLELLRTWRSVEALYGSPKPNLAEDNIESKRTTLLTDMREIAGVLRSSEKQMTDLRESINNPIAVARRMVTEYELARAQVDFVDHFARAISNTSDMTAKDSQAEVDAREYAKKLVALLPQTLYPFHCTQRWYVAAKTIEMDDVSTSSFSSQIAERLIDALEPDLEGLIAKTAPDPLELKSFPFPECSGLFVDALRKLESAQESN